LALTPGIRLGPYEILSAIGAGGMGEVYKARDTTLDRAVAIKILPDAFVSDPERVARFQREAKTLASLNHPNIGGIHGLEHSGGVTALVMELVEGEDLSQRIARGAILIDDSWPIAHQIAEALEAAHAQGVIHRDLKPANIKVRPDGTVKVLDFGLAKGMAPIGSAPHMSQSPTITTPAKMTGVGVILGTAAYMSPEQAKGKPVDKRADIWAFGAVLFEMLTGTRAFDGEDVGDTLAAVLRAEPDWNALPAEVTFPVRTLLRGCLEKDPRQRIGDISAALFVLRHQAPGAAIESPTHVGHVGRADMRRVALFTTAALILGAALAGTGVWLLARPTPPSVVRTTITTSGSTAFALSGVDRDLAITADGSRVVYRGNNQLLVRALNQLEPTVLSGLGAPQGVFISPDGQWVGFFDGFSLLKKVAITGGPPARVCAIQGVPGGATWRADGTIIFATIAATGL
jgi:serine/threonine protein kinase